MHVYHEGTTRKFIKSIASLGRRGWRLVAAVGVVAMVVGVVIGYIQTEILTPNYIVDNVAIRYSDLSPNPTIRIPVTGEAATLLGWEDFGRCQVGRGRFFFHHDAHESQPLLPIYHKEDQLVGINVGSVTEQPAPPWELEETPITNLQGRDQEHWGLGIYFVPVRITSATCGLYTPGPRLGFD